MLLSARGAAAATALLKATSDAAVNSVAEEVVGPVVDEDASISGVVPIPAAGTKGHTIDRRLGKSASKVWYISMSRG